MDGCCLRIFKTLTRCFWVPYGVQRRGERGVQIPDQRLELAGALAANRLVSQNTRREDINTPVVRTVSYD